MALAVVAIYYGVDTDGDFAVRQSFEFFNSHLMDMYTHMNTFTTLYHLPHACPVSLQVMHVAFISVFSFLFMIPISIVVPWMFQV